MVSGGCPKGGDRFAEIIAKGTGIKLTFMENQQVSLEIQRFQLTYSLCI